MAADKLFYEDDNFYDDCTDADYEEFADAFKDDLQDKFLDEAEFSELNFELADVEFDEFVQEPIKVKEDTTVKKKKRGRIKL